ncbi:MAG TPA: hypothetical protein PL044_06275 [Clostridiales bacterium]|nr:hypothetical protein [Clostridiales bacterium]
MMSAFSLTATTKKVFGRLAVLLMAAALLTTVFGACTPESIQTDANQTTAQPSDAGLTSLEAQKLAWSKAKGVFDDCVLFRMAPVESKDSTALKLSADWQTSDRSGAWFAWYADSNSGDWFMVSIVGKKIDKVDIGTRSFSAEAFDSALPKENTAVSMKDAASAAKAQGANMDVVTWVEFQCERFSGSAGRLPLWVFTCSDTLDSGVTLNYKIYVNAATGKVEGALNDRNEDMALPIDIEDLQKPRTENHEADLRKFFSFISQGEPVWAVRQLEHSLSPDEATAQMWLANFQSLKTLEVVSVEQTNLEQWTDQWESYKVVLNVTTDETPDKYGWENGENTRWITLVPQGAGDWKIASIGTSP